MSTESSPLLRENGREETSILEGYDGNGNRNGINSTLVDGSGNKIVIEGRSRSSSMSFGNTLIHRLLRQKSEQEIVSDLEEERIASEQYHLEQQQQRRGNSTNDPNSSNHNSNGNHVHGGQEDRLVLKRTLTLFQVVCFGIGTTVGAGLFVTTGTLVLHPDQKPFYRARR